MSYIVSVTAAELHLCDARKRKILAKLRTRGLTCYLAMLDEAEAGNAAATVEDIVRRAQIPERTAHRGMDDITALGLVERAFVPEDKGAAFCLAPMRTRRASA